MYSGLRGSTIEKKKKIIFCVSFLMNIFWPIKKLPTNLFKILLPKYRTLRYDVGNLSNQNVKPEPEVILHEYINLNIKIWE